MEQAGHQPQRLAGRDLAQLEACHREPHQRDQHPGAAEQGVVGGVLNHHEGDRGKPQRNVDADADGSRRRPTASRLRLQIGERHVFPALWRLPQPLLKHELHLQVTERVAAQGIETVAGADLGRRGSPAAGHRRSSRLRAPAGAP